jgi:HD superfamily phosphohydrolase
MHLAGKLYSLLIDQYSSEREIPKAVTDEQTKAINYLGYCFRLAALLHDTGHFPFSHEFERTKVIGSLLSETTILSDFWGKSALYEKYAKKGVEERKRSKEGSKEEKFHVTHEEFSLAAAYHILTSIDKLPVEVDDVLCLMESSCNEYTEEWVESCRIVFEMFDNTPIGKQDEPIVANGIRTFFSIMISGEVDVDKMDYLLRDSYFSGAKYGVYNLDHLLSTIRLGFNLESKWFGVAILEKGLTALEDFIFSRFQVYQNLWSHKAVAGNKMLLSNALEEMMRGKDVADKKAIEEKIKTYINDRNNFVYFTDNFFMESFRMKSREDKQGKSAAFKFLSRKPPKFIGRRTNLGSEGVKDFQADASKHLECKAEEIVYRKDEIFFKKTEKMSDDHIMILLRPEPQPGTDKKRRKLKSVVDCSTFIATFLPEGLKIYNFFYNKEEV